MSDKERDRLLEEAREANAKGQLEVASDLCEQALRISPAFPPAKLLMGMVAARSGRPEAAIGHLQDIAQDDGASFDAQLGLAIVYRGAGRVHDAIQAARRAVALRPRAPRAHLNLGLALMDASQLEEALASFDQAILFAPDLAAAHHSRALLLQKLNRRPEAVTGLRRASELAPNAILILLDLCQALLMGGDPKGAAECAERALAIDPRLVPGFVLLSHARADEGRFEESEEALRKAIASDPRSHQSHHHMAMLLQQMGRFEEARRYLDQSLALEPRQGQAYFYTAQMMKAGAEDGPLIERIESLLAEEGVPLADQALLHYASGKLLEDLGQYERAMRHFEQGSRASYVASYGDAPFNRSRYEQASRRMSDLITTEVLERHRGAGISSELPVLICGMVRSGTTLVEQIVSSHPEVGGAGEQEFWYENRWSAINYHTGKLDPVKLKQDAERYVKLLSGIAPDAARVTDKLPGNAGALGLIHLALPNARLLHVQRNPLDTCVSILATWFQRPPEFVASKGDLVFAYRQYLQVVDHWRKVLPSDRFLDVSYEELTAEPERVTRSIIAFCGLEWSDACMAPDENDRRVKTPSLWQVRKPVNSSAVERWRRYEPWLGELLELLPSKETA